MNDDYVTKKQTILNTVSDLVSDFLYYDRKEDEVLSRNDIKIAFRDRYVTVDEVTEKFRQEIQEWLDGIL